MPSKIKQSAATADLTEEQVADLKEAFAMFDINGDGTLCSEKQRGVCCWLVRGLQKPVFYYDRSKMLLSLGESCISSLGGLVLLRIKGFRGPSMPIRCAKSADGPEVGVC